MINFPNNSMNLIKIIYREDVIKEEIEKIIKYDFIMFCDVSSNENDYSKNEALDHFHFFFASIPYYLIIKTKEEVKIYNYDNYNCESASLNLNAYNELEEHFKNLPNMLNYKHKYLYKFFDFEHLKDIDIDSTFYININKYNIDFEQYATDLEFWISVNPANNHCRANRFVDAYNINSILESIKEIRYDRETYYLKLVKAMCEKNNFKKYYSEITNFEDKITILEIYKEYNEQKSIRNGGNKDELFK